jgi:beta-1,4-mannosyl-glycoprotein beta-1,4-N-acetylglucosaminyltransferase
MLAQMRIFDTFPFDGELSLLEHRLAETADLVDAFVIVEAGETFQGLPKSMTFADNRTRFAAYDHKIRYVSLPRLGAQGTDPWRREQIQRDAIHFALGDAGPDDIVLILDADEVPSRELLIRLRQDGLDAPRRLLMTRHYQAVDRLGPRSPCCPDPFAPFAFAHPRLRPGAWDDLAIDWFSRSGVAAPFRTLMSNEGGGRRSLFDVRRTAPSAGGFPDAGRHLCFVDPSARPLYKLGRNAHGELASMRGDPAAHLARCERDDLHHRGWWYAEQPTGPLPEDLKRLVARVPELNCKSRPARAPIRIASRTWAWLRLWNGLSNTAVRAVDRCWDWVWPALAIGLMGFDCARSLAAHAPAKRRKAAAGHFQG